MAQQERLEALRGRHTQVDQKLLEEQGRPSPKEVEISRLKRKKLRLKDEISALSPLPPSDSSPA